ncbi:MAG: hypothetical protein MUF87_17200 [Anaerolineae bacterium]|nr:hypothetical protein [Anaerolineae bacterium]
MSDQPSPEKTPSVVEDQTHSKRPLPPRPVNGFTAWQATLGHISTHHSPDATLKIELHSEEARVIWSAVVSWGGRSEQVQEQASLPAALKELWREVSRHHQIFETLEDAVKSPMNYDDTDWLDLVTHESLQRLIWVTQITYPGDWHLVIVYQPVESPNMRVQMRLLAKNNTIAVGGKGPSLLEACRILFRNATPHYSGQNPVT